MTHVHLAYDGSISGDWIALYALRMAHAAGGRLDLVHVQDAEASPATIDKGVERLTRRAAELDVALDHRTLPCTGDVARTLLAELRHAPEDLVICGLRARESGRGLLRGTVSERLLARAQPGVLALRVLAPGLLGAPRHALYAASHRVEGAHAVADMLALLVPSLERVSVLRVAEPSSHQANALTPTSRARLLERERAHLEQVRRRVDAVLDHHGVRVDGHTSLASSWAHEVVRHGAQVKAQLMVLGASERTLPLRMVAGNPLERVLHEATSDVAIYRPARGA